MTKILHIDTSSSLEPSTSRQLTEYLVNKLTQSPGNLVTKRDLGKMPIPHIDEHTVQAFYQPEETHSEEAAVASKRSENLIGELLDHDIIVLGVPMYNYTIPSPLKAYIDHVARPGYTFNFTPTGFEGLIKNKRVIVIITRAGALTDSIDNHQEPYLKTIFSFLGIENVTFIIAENLINEPDKKATISQARSQINDIVAQED